MNTEEFNALAKQPGKLNENTLEQLEKLAVEFPFFQAGWILYLKNLKVTRNPDFEKVLKKVALLVPDRKQLFYFLNDTHQAKKIDLSGREKLNTEYNLGENDVPAGGDSLIDKFLSLETGPVRLEKMPENGSSKFIEDGVLEKSDAENDELVTETLAMIYFEQKKYDKALDAFRKLSLKYPEKSIYFATRIEEIEKLKNI
ncbi:MAG TPA: tetratricopeptide repeat protein [Prolixibacteraceae bacterium]|nr:tetratricopeptide repeat protein [Prolixibacteraceae bacterium]